MKTRIFVFAYGLLLWLGLGLAGLTYGADSAVFVSQSVPKPMNPGQTYAVSITMQNNGTTTWTSGSNFNLGSQNAQDNTRWGMNRVSLPNSVAPGTNVTFNFNVTAPTASGIYNFQWMMVHDGVAWFGQQTANVSVGVGNNAAFVSQTVPTGMVSNQTYAVSVTMQNLGGNTWIPGDYYLGSMNPQDNTRWGMSRVELPNAVAPGESVTFNFNVKPTVGGSQNFQWQMTQGGARYGPLTPNVAVSVSGTDSAQFISQSVPTQMVPGQVYAVSVTMGNTGNTTWSASNAISLGSQNPQDNTRWGMNRVSLSNSVAPGASGTFNFNVTAPTAPGIHNFQWKMVHDGVAWFGPLTTNVAVTVAANVAPTVSLSSPENNSVFSSPANLTLTAVASDSDGSIQKVEFFHGGTNLIATVTSPPYTYNWTNVASGAYVLTAKATDNFNATTTSGAVNISVSGPGSSTPIYFIHTDHLNTPRVITNQAAQVVWRWDNTDPFGGNPPEENPSGLGNFTCNLRLPGQYFDKEINTHYNYFRDYDPLTGRYVQSDPIGLNGGLNTYAYVNSNPLSFIDPDGQFGIVIPLIIPTIEAIGAAIASQAPAIIGAAAIITTASISGSTSQDDKTPSRTIPKPKRPPCGCTCNCRADANQNDPRNTAAFAFGTATEHDCATASKVAKRNATRALGQQPKHIDCRCEGR